MFFGVKSGPDYKNSRKMCSDKFGLHTVYNLRLINLEPLYYYYLNFTSLLLKTLRSQRVNLDLYFIPNNWIEETNNNY